MNKYKSIAIGGSAANPIHNGHVLLLWFLTVSKKFDLIIWIPTGERKDKPNLITADHRTQMTSIAIPKWMLINNLLIDFSEVYGEARTTFDALSEYDQRYKNSKKYFFTGSDTFYKQENLNNNSEIKTKWYKGDELIDNVQFVIFPRAGFSIKKCDLPKHSEIINLKKIFLKNFYKLPISLWQYIPFILLTGYLPDAKSKDIRQSIQNNHKPKHLSKMVWQYIKKTKIYK